VDQQLAKSSNARKSQSGRAQLQAVLHANTARFCTIRTITQPPPRRFAQFLCRCWPSHRFVNFTVRRPQELLRAQQRPAMARGIRCAALKEMGAAVRFQGGQHTVGRMHGRWRISMAITHANLWTEIVRWRVCGWRVNLPTELTFAERWTSIASGTSQQPSQALPSGTACEVRTTVVVACALRAQASAYRRRP
jgi:hypothetical protein